MSTEIDLFVNASAKHYKNRLFDKVLNILEKNEWIPKEVSQALRQKKAEDYFYEKAYRQADKYGRIMRNQGYSHVTITLEEFHRLLAQSLRERPNLPKIICSGDGGIKEALTTGITYVDTHNELETKVAQVFDEIILNQDKCQNLNLELQSFLRNLPLDSNLALPSVSCLARAVIKEKKVDFSFLNGHLDLNPEEKKFIAYYHLSLADLLGGKVSYPLLGFIRGGTFNVLSHHLSLEKDTSYLEDVLDQMAEAHLSYTHFKPLCVEYQDPVGNEKKLYGTIFAHQAVREFFRRYYEGKMTSGPLKAVSILLYWGCWQRKELAELTKPRLYSYEVEHADGRKETFEQKTVLSVVTTINRMPFDVRFFAPQENYLQTTVTEKSASQLLWKACLSIPQLREVLRKVGIRDTIDIEHNYTDVTQTVIRENGDGPIRFILDGDMRDAAGNLYDTSKVKLSLGPELKIINPRGEYRF